MSDVLYDVQLRLVIVNGETFDFPPLVAKSDDDPALRFAEQVARQYRGRPFIIGLPPPVEAPLISDAERRKRMLGIERKRRMRERIKAFGDNGARVSVP